MKVLYIDFSNSVCGVCGRGAYPQDKAHIRTAGYSDEARAQKPCEVEWTHVSSNYSGGGQEEAVRMMRPDLIWVDYFESLRVG